MEVPVAVESSISHRTTSEGSLPPRPPQRQLWAMPVPPRHPVEGQEVVRVAEEGQMLAATVIIRTHTYGHNRRHTIPERDPHHVPLADVQAAQECHKAAAAVVVAQVIVIPTVTRICCQRGRGHAGRTPCIPTTPPHRWPPPPAPPLPVQWWWLPARCLLEHPRPLPPRPPLPVTRWPLPPPHHPVIAVTPTE